MSLRHFGPSALISLTLIIVASALFVSTYASAHSGATGIVKERMDLFQRNKDHLKSIKRHLAKNDTKPIIVLAKEIGDWAARMPDYFPAGSDGKPSEAAPQIWVDFAGFKNAARANQTAAEQLAAAAAANDLEAAVTAFRAVAASCKSCHKTYRQE